MVDAKRFPMTPVTDLLDKSGAIYEKHLYNYLRKGADVAAEQLGVDGHIVIKTLVMQRDNGEPVIILMHGDKEVSLKEFARQIGAKTVQPCDPKDAQRFTGYMVGGISPFATKRAIPIYVEETVLQLHRLWINGGQRGFILDMDPAVLIKLLTPKTVKVAR